MPKKNVGDYILQYFIHKWIHLDKFKILLIIIWKYKYGRYSELGNLGVDKYPSVRKKIESDKLSNQDLRKDGAYFLI